MSPADPHQCRGPHCYKGGDSDGLRCVRCPFKRKGAARQTQERREAKQRQKLQELVGAAKLASKAKVKAAFSARVAELELKAAVHDQWASGAGEQIGHWQGKCFKERLAREKAEWGLQARMAFEREDRHKETQRALAQPTIVPRTAYKVWWPASGSAAPSARSQKMLAAAKALNGMW